MVVKITFEYDRVGQCWRREDWGKVDDPDGIGLLEEVKGDFELSPEGVEEVTFFFDNCWWYQTREDAFAVFDPFQVSFLNHQLNLNWRSTTQPDPPETPTAPPPVTPPPAPLKPEVPRYVHDGVSSFFDTGNPKTIQEIASPKMRKRTLAWVAGGVIILGLIINGVSAQQAESANQNQPSSVVDIQAPFENCTEAEYFGEAPVYEGDPGWGSHLDRDGDGVGCE